MKKKLLPLAIAAVMAPGFAAAADVSGYTDIIYMMTDDANKPVAPALHSTEGKFSATGELDFSASPADGVTVRMDIDLALALNNGANASAATGGPGDSAVMEQAFFAWGATEGVTVIGGVFNNPIGQEAQDAPDMIFTTGGMVGAILDAQTALHSNNIAGLAVAGAVGPTTVTVAYVNDLNQTNEENSMALVVNYSPLAGLDLELGLATQADQAKNAASAEDVTNFNVLYAPAQVAGLTVGLDYLTTGKIVDAAYDLWAGYDAGNGVGVQVRFSDADYTAASGAADADSTTFRLSYQAASNLTAAIEFRTDGVATPGSSDTDTTQLELLATF